MYTIKLNIDASIFDEFMDLLNTLPQDKIEYTTEKKDLNSLIVENKITHSLEEHHIENLLRTNSLTHFKFLRSPDRILTPNTGSIRYKEDYKKLISVLKKEGIKYEAVGFDLLYIGDESEDENNS